MYEFDYDIKNSVIILIMLLPIHTQIKEKLQYFHQVQKIPHIIFHGPSGSGKKTLLNNFIHTIYKDDKEKIKTYVMYVNCAHGKGIKFIRDELKFFAKTHIHSNGGDIFKSIVLLNADKLTMDAQSALRRCIELFSHSTRFFIVVEDKYKLLKPILSRFCEIYVPEPTYQGKTIHLHQYHLQETFLLKDAKTKRFDSLKKILSTFSKKEDKTIQELESLSCELYEKGYCGLDLIQVIEKTTIFKLTQEKKYEYILGFNKVRKEFRNEKILMLFVLHFIYLDKEASLDSLSFV